MSSSEHRRTSSTCAPGAAGEEELLQTDIRQQDTRENEVSAECQGPPQDVNYQHALERLTLISQITNPVVGLGPLQQQAYKLLEQVRIAYGVDACVVRTLEGQYLNLLAATGVPMSQLVEKFPAYVGISKRMIEERRPLSLEDVHTEATTAAFALRARYDTRKFQFRSYAGAPLLVEDSVVGILGIYSIHQKRRFDESELNHLQIVANHIAISIVNDRLYRELKENREALREQIQERERAQRERQSIEEQLRHSQRMEALGHLAGGVAHDFNNLLTVILGGTEQLRERLRLPTPNTETEWIDHIDGAARRAANLTRQLLAFSRKQPNNPTVFDLVGLVRGLQKILRRLVRENIELSVTCEDEPLPIRADAGQIEQVIINLVVNARDAISGQGHVEVGCTRLPMNETETETVLPEGKSGQRFIKLWVRDDGKGMDPVIAGRVFEPFFTTKAAGAGTGLGLSTAYGIVKQAGGKICVNSTPQQGSTFIVYVPMHTDTVVESEKTESRVAATPGSGVVLVCEDDASVRRIICATLNAAGYQVLQASNGDAALELVRSRRDAIDLLITDMVMPGINGRQLAQRLHDTYPKLPYLLVSGYLGDAGEGNSPDWAQEHTLSKPFGPRVLLERVREILGTGA